MILKITANNPCLIDDKAYFCDIVGDGKIYHFGVIDPKH